MTTIVRIGGPSGAAGPKRVTCPLGANCSCALSANFVAPAVPHELARSNGALSRATKSWTDLGYRVVTSGEFEVTLERKRGGGFCANLFLTAATALIWLFVWIPRMRRPIYDRVVLAQAGDSVVTEKTVRR